MVMENQQGGYIANPLTIPLAMASLLALVMGGLTVYFYAQNRDARQNIDDKVAAAVVDAEAGLREQLQKEFDEKAKDPFRTYTASEIFSGIQVAYPKTWSAYVVEDSKSRRQLDGYFHPNYVPSDKAGVKYALRLSFEDGDYTKVLNQYKDAVEKKSLKASAIEINGIKGTRLDGKLDKDISGAIVILPIRDKVLKVWTESPAFLADFNQIVSGKLTFKP